MTSLAVLALWPEPETIAHMAEEAFVRHVRDAHPGERLRSSKLRALHAQAGQSAGIKAGSNVVAAELRRAAQRLGLMTTQVKEWEGLLTQLVYALPESGYVLSIPGVGPLTAAGLLGELGPFSRYRSGKQLVKMAGTHPTESESAGHRSWRTPMSKKGRAGLRWCLWMAALALLRNNEDFANWAQALRERPVHEHPLKYREAVGAVGNRLLRIAFALVKKEEYYHAPTPQAEAAWTGGQSAAHQVGGGHREWIWEPGASRQKTGCPRPPGQPRMKDEGTAPWGMIPYLGTH